MLYNSTQIVMKLKNLNCDETIKFKLGWNSNSNFDQTQKLKLWLTSKLKLWLNSKTHCHKTQKLKLWWNSTQIVMKLKTSNGDKPQIQIGTKLIDSNSYKAQKFKLWKNFKTWIVTKLKKNLDVTKLKLWKNSNCDETKIMITQNMAIWLDLVIWNISGTYWYFLVLFATSCDFLFLSHKVPKSANL